jgi:hypothetical protein
MLNSFLLTIFSSWIISPLAILVAYLFNVANNLEIVLVLLCIGACAPFQLVMNECIAAAETQGRFNASHHQIALILLTQAISCFATLMLLTTQYFPIFYIIIVVFLLAVSTFLSREISTIFYRLVLKSSIKYNQLILVGIIPGSTCLLLYFFYSVAESVFNLTAVYLILISTCLPAIIQLKYLKYIYKNTEIHSGFKESSILQSPSMSWLLTTLVAVSTLTIFATLLREFISIMRPNYISIILVSLNITLSLVNTLTRVLFLSGLKYGQKKFLGMALVSFCLVTFFSYIFGWWAWPFIGLLSVQIATAFAIEISRLTPSH